MNVVHINGSAEEKYDEGALFKIPKPIVLIGGKPCTSRFQFVLAAMRSNFKSGLRGNAPQDTSGNMMAAITKSLSKAQIEKVSQYLATQPFVSAPPPTNTGGFMGRGLYRNCGSCHGAQAQGEPELHAPRLAGQHGWYLLAQLQKFKAGLRGLHAKDKFGQQMHMVSQGLDFETQVPSILAFIAHRKVLPSHDNSASRH